ncbi:DUF1840 domain-containing protein [Pseudacidovorax intermedius]|uniref:DUF1840 domain-containing protein n=1 Tax=Pseudacidovorax intermedius TaxID=433924 RepID=A0A147GXA0_9BURK|nr:DUF1840 domain-containing protein [Pseudacidovorax intermedius]KTT22199.1 hypothetical protein NS331_09905 [Pseudacidovorax intermedius]
MLYRFKSQASADVVMLEPSARHLLEIIGKSPGAQGVITVDQMPGAISALEAAVANEAKMAHHGTHDAHAMEEHDAKSEIQHVSLHQRATPLIHMLRESHDEGKDIVWGT